MTIPPFLALRLRGKKDAVLARQRARRVASLLRFDLPEQACIAAGTFVVACQALLFYGKARLCFQIENHQLHIFAEDAQANDAIPPASNRLGKFLPAIDPKTLYRLTKSLPSMDSPAEELDLGWLVSSIEQTAREGVFDELVRQNQEVLSLLSELRLYQGTLKEKEEKPTQPHAA